MLVGKKSLVLVEGHFYPENEEINIHTRVCQAYYCLIGCFVKS